MDYLVSTFMKMDGAVIIDALVPTDKLKELEKSIAKLKIKDGGKPLWCISSPKVMLADFVFSVF